MARLVALLAFAIQLLNVAAECPNACNGHGSCTSYDMCICNRNWQANDCSERTCQFGLAHVDTPKGDLNQDGMITNADEIVIQNNFIYPFGTTEQFPRMQDSSLVDLDQSAHYYMECSNKGSCDRKSGECQCFDGYDGAACQRASCPGFPDSCSGHGVCKTIRQLAEADNNNIYELWDRHSTMGCECDAGFFGPDCSLRQCKFGIDPLYLDDSATIKYATFDFAVLHTEPADSTAGSSTTDFTNGMRDDKPGQWAIRFYDMHGEDWLTRPITAGAQCQEVINALNELPNDVIPFMDVSLCTRISKTAQNPIDSTTGNPNEVEYSGWNSETDKYYNDGSHGFTSGAIAGRPIILKMAFWLDEFQNRSSINSALPTNQLPDTIDAKDYLLTGEVYRIHFFHNPGNLRQPEIETYLDGERPALISVDSTSKAPKGKVITSVWTDGQQGESYDFIADHCDGVSFTLKSDVHLTTLAGLTTEEVALLKTCLGEADFDFGNNKDVYEWDHGSIDYPHMVKLVRTVTTYEDGGYYAALIWNNAQNRFELINQMHASDDENSATDNTLFVGAGKADNTNQYEIYTTHGTLARVSPYATAYFGFGSREIFSVNKTFDTEKTHRPDPLGKKGGSYDGDISCELSINRPNAGSKGIFDVTYINNASVTQANEVISHCLNKEDYFTVLNFNNRSQNPAHINLYTAKKLYQKQYKYKGGANYRFQTNAGVSPYQPLTFQTFTINTDLSTNWANGLSDDTNFYFYKFYPDSRSTYNYVAQCSNRGICKEDTGLCECFSGYTGDSCSEQNSLAV